MPIINGRLVCSTCGADLGFDEDELFADPSCAHCTAGALDEFEASFGDVEELDEAPRLDEPWWRRP